VDAPVGSRKEKREKPAGLSLRSHHEKLTLEGYVPPPPPEVHFEYAGKMSGRRLLTDQDVIYIRKVIGSLGYTELAKRFNVGYQVIHKAAKGYTYKHLNLEHPPQL
jgi:hypothetical protein